MLQSLEETKDITQTDNATQNSVELDILELENDLDFLFGDGPSKYGNNLSDSCEQKNQIITEILGAMMNNGEFFDLGIDNSSMATIKKTLEEKSIEQLKEILESYNSNIVMNNTNGIGR